MSLSPIPRGVYPSATDISPSALAAKGIRLVLADLDNTLVPYKVAEPPAAVIAWKEALEAQGLRLFLLSNSRRPGRVLLRKSATTSWSLAASIQTVLRLLASSR